MKLQGKKALIIGGSSGIGFAIARCFLEEGAEVTIVGHNQAKLDKSVQILGDRTREIEADITDENQVHNVFDLIHDLDILVLTASTSATRKFAEFTTEFVDKVFRTKFYSALWAVKYAIPKINAGGSIIAISGIWGHRPPTGFVVGAAVNGAVEGFIRALAIEFAESNIRVNCISPGITKTHAGIEEENNLYKKYLEEIPLGRFGQPSEIADAALFLATNTYITGTILNIDGGSLIGCY